MRTLGYPGLLNKANELLLGECRYCHGLFRCQLIRRLIAQPQAGASIGARADQSQALGHLVTVGRKLMRGFTTLID